MGRPPGSGKFKKNGSVFCFKKRKQRQLNSPNSPLFSSRSPKTDKSERLLYKKAVEHHLQTSIPNDRIGLPAYMVGFEDADVQMSPETRMTTIDQIRPRWSKTISFEEGLTSPVSYNKLELLARNALWGATSSYEFGPMQLLEPVQEISLMQPVKPAGTVWDIVRNWEAVEPAELAQRITLDDYMKAYEAQNIDPVRLHRYYANLRLFSQSKFSDKHCNFDQRECWKSALSVVHETEDFENSEINDQNSLAYILKTGEWFKATWPSHVPLGEWKNKNLLTKDKTEWDVLLNRSDHELSDSCF